MFRSVYGTPFVSNLPPFLVIENLWGATLHAIFQEIQGTQSPTIVDATNQLEPVSQVCEVDPVKTVLVTEAVANNVELALQSIKGWSRLNNRQQKILRCLLEQRNTEVSFFTLKKLSDVFKIDISEDGIKKAIDRIKGITELDITVRLKPQKCRPNLPEED
ncbi:hypothetical protein GC163_22200 [bacterium]|nr:hypothetical protein [bacterium]